MDHSYPSQSIRPGLFLRILVAVLVSISSYSTSGLSATNTIHLTLDAAIEMALRTNRSLTQTGYNLKGQALSLEAARSEFDLKIKPASRVGVEDGKKAGGFGVDLVKKFDVGIQASLKPEVERIDELYSGRAGVSLRIPLLRGFGRQVNLNTVYSSQYSRRASRRSFYTARVNLVLDTVAAVYDIQKQSQLVKLYDFQRARLAGYAETARIKEGVGLASPLDIYRAEIRLKDAENSSSTARESVANAKDRLKLILALPLEKKIRITAPIVVEPVRIDPDEAVKLALENRIELEQKADDIREARRKSDIARHNMRPRLDLIIGYDRFDSDSRFQDSFGFNQDRWGVYLTSDTDLSRTSEKLDYQKSLLNVKNNEVNLKQTMDEINREVRRQLKALDKARQRIEIRTKQLHQADGKRALAILKFNYGMANNFDVIEAETERQRAQVDLISTKIDYIIGTYRIRSVLGTLIER